MSAESGRQFVDTNILIYAYDRTAERRQARARELVAGLWQSRRGCLSVQVLQEFYVVATRKLPRMATADLRTILADLSLWRVYTMLLMCWLRLICISATKSRFGMP